MGAVRVLSTVANLAFKCEGSNALNFRDVTFAMSCFLKLFKEVSYIQFNKI